MFNGLLLCQERIVDAMYSIDDKTVIERLSRLDPIILELIHSMLLQSEAAYDQFLVEHKKRFQDQIATLQLCEIFSNESKCMKQYYDIIDNITEILAEKHVLTGTEEENRMEMKSHVHIALLNFFKEIE